MAAWETEVHGLLDSGKYAEALTVLNTLRTPDDPDEVRHIRQHEAECLREMGRLQEALALYDDLLKDQETGVWDACLFLLSAARILKDLGKFSAAKKRLKKIHEIDSDGEFEVDVELMEIYIKVDSGRLPEAIRDAHLFLEKHKDKFAQGEYAGGDYILERTIACALVDKGQYALASEMLQRLLPTAPEEDQGLLHLRLGAAYDHLGELLKAIECFKKALGKSPTEDFSARVHFHLGDVYLKTGAGAWAKQHLMQAEQMKLPSDIPLKDIYRFLAATCDYLGETEEKQKYERLSRQSI
jgi:tetratricopeptide (TPR) repeat protein